MIIVENNSESGQSLFRRVLQRIRLVFGSYWLDFLLGLIAPACLILIVLAPVLFGSGFIFYGDITWGFYWSSGVIFKFLIYAWNNGPNSFSFFFFGAPLALLLLFGNYFANHAFSFLLAFLPGPTSYIAILLTLSLFFPTANANLRRVSAFVGSMFYLLNWQNQGLIQPTITWAMSYIVMPLCIYLFIKVVRKPNLKDAMLFGIVSSIGDVIPAWIPFILLFAVVYVPMYIFLTSGIPRKWTNLGRSLLLLTFFTLVFNAYAFVEIFFGFFTGAGGSFGIYGSSSTQLSTAVSSSIMSLFDVLMFGHPTYYGFGTSPQNWTFLSVFIPLMAIVYLFQLLSVKATKTYDSVGLFVTRSKFVRVEFISLFLLLCISLFLAKGVNPPLGNLYKDLVLYSPPGIVGITRDVTPWLMLSAVSYSFISGLVMFIGLNALRQADIIRYWRKLKRSDTSVWMHLLVVAVVLLAIVASAQSMFISLGSGQTSTYLRYTPDYPPSYYGAAISYIESNGLNGTVMWIPTGGTYSWKGNEVLSGWGPNLIRNSSFPYYAYQYLFDSNFTKLGIVLSATDTEYLVYQASGSLAFNWPINYNQSYILSRLNSQSDLKLVFNTSQIWVYKNLESISQIYTGLPTYGSPFPSLFNISTQHFIPYSNVYVNSTSTFVTLNQLGLLNSSHTITFDGIDFRGKNVTLTAGQTAYSQYSKVQTLYAFNNSLFYDVTMSVAGGEFNVSGRYIIPPYLTPYAGNGTWNGGFDMEANVYPWNQNPLWGPVQGDANLIYNVPGTDQFNQSSTSGYFYFKIPETNMASLYLTYHLGDFSVASPVYYIGTIINDTLSSTPAQQSPPKTELSTLQFNSSRTLQPYYVVYSGPKILVINSSPTLVYNATLFYPNHVLIGNNLTANQQYLSESNIVPIIYSVNETGAVFPLSGTISVDTSGTILEASTPVPGNYTLNLTVLSGSLLIGNSTFGVGSYDLYYHMSNVTMSIPLRSVSGVTEAAFYLSLHKVNTISKVSNYNVISPVSYTAQYFSTGESLVIFTQQFSSSWSLSFNGKIYRPFSLFGGYATGFLIPNGSGKLKITYGLQVYGEIGGIITASGYISLLLLLTHKRYWKQLRHIHIFKFMARH